MDVVGPTAVEEVVASLTPAMEVAGAMVVGGATAMVHGAMVVVLFGIGKTPSHSSPDRPLTTRPVSNGGVFA